MRPAHAATPPSPRAGLPFLHEAQAARAKAHVVTPEDAALFREAIGEVRELAPPPPTARAPASRRPSRACRRATRRWRWCSRARRPTWPRPSTRPRRCRYRRDETPEKVLKALKRGQYSLRRRTATCTRLRAHDAERWLREFLRSRRAGGHACVRIIHGKGPRAADGGSVLKDLVDRLLAPARGRAGLRLRAGSDGRHRRGARAAGEAAAGRTRTGLSRRQSLRVRPVRGGLTQTHA